MQAANALRDIADARAIPALIPALDDPVFTVRNTVERALVSFEKKAEPEILKLLDAEDVRTRRHAVRALAAIHSEAAIEPLRQLLKDPDWGVRGDAVRALHAIVPEQRDVWEADLPRKESHPFVTTGEK